MDFERYLFTKTTRKSNTMIRIHIRKELLLVPFMIFSLIAAMVIPVVPVSADDPEFSLSSSSGRAGLVIQIEQVDPCPALPSGALYQDVAFTFIDHNNVVTPSQYSAYTEPSGDWADPTILSIPWRSINMVNNPPVTTNQAATGMGSITARCIVTTSTGDDEMDINDDITYVSQTYAPEPFNVTGGSREFTVSATSIDTGTVLHIESVNPCPGTEIHGSVGNNQAVNNFYVEMTGNWSVDIPMSSADPMTEEVTNFPPGEYAVTAFCMGTQSYNYHYYGDQLINVNGPYPNYVALGDSYSSGEGLGSYESGTDQAGVNMCHRSEGAYPRLLAANGGLPLNLGTNGFAACSGAKTASITLGAVDNEEGPQLDKITANTDLITMTIGGNNMNFAAFGQDCYWNDCSGAGKSTAIANISNNVIAQMEYTLGTIRDRLINLDNEDATVLILGYPHVVTDSPYMANLAAVGCEWLNSTNEANAIRDVVTTLNTAVKNEVDAIGYDFHFISATGSGSPFTSHELCRNSFVYGMPYFFNVSIPVTTSFHPNTLGHEAYAELVEDYLSNNPLD